MTSVLTCTLLMLLMWLTLVEEMTPLVLSVLCRPGL